MVTAHHQSVLATTPFKFIRPGGLVAASAMNHSAKPLRSSVPTNASANAPTPKCAARRRGQTLLGRSPGRVNEPEVLVAHALRWTDVADGMFMVRGRAVEVENQTRPAFRFASSTARFSRRGPRPLPTFPNSFHWESVGTFVIGLSSRLTGQLDRADIDVWTGGVDRDNTCAAAGLWARGPRGR